LTKLRWNCMGETVATWRPQIKVTSRISVEVIDICQIWLANELEWTPWCMHLKSLSELPKRKKLTDDDMSRLERLRMLSLTGIF
jgi:hypothetical protein